MNQNHPNNLIRQILESAMLTIGLLILLFFWINSPYSFSVESTFIRPVSVLRSTFHPSSNNDFKSNVWLVNAGTSGVLVNDFSGEGDERIIDRAKIDSFLIWLNKNGKGDHIILCDLLFDKPTPADSSLALRFATTPNLFLPTVSNKTPPILVQGASNAVQGFVDYEKTNEWTILDDKFSKFQLMNKNGDKSLPLRMYETLYNHTATMFGGIMSMGNKIYFNNITFDEFLRSYELNGESLYYNEKFPINTAIQLLMDNDAFSEDYLNRKFIIIGDFDKDLHSTAFGEVPGSVILFNVYASLLNKSNQIRLDWVLLVFVGFMFIIQYSLFGGLPRCFKKVHAKMKAYFGSFFDYLIGRTLMVWILSCVSYFIYGISVDIIASVVLLGVIIYLRGIVARIYYVLSLSRAQRNWSHLFYIIFD